jgi:hypothetical protein
MVKYPLKTVAHTAILMIMEGQFQAFQWFSSSKLLLKTVESCFAAFNCYENGSMSSIFLSLQQRYSKKEAKMRERLKEKKQ